MQRNRLGTFVASLLVILLAPRYAPVVAAEAVIDSFSDASAQTQFVTDTNVRRGTLGSTTRVDPGLTGVIGGVRQLTVTATEIDVPSADFIVAGVSLLPMTLFLYDSTVGGDGSTTLLYDGNGSGLNAYLAFAQGIEVIIVTADASAVAPPGLDVKLTLTDASLVPISQTQTVLLPVSPGTPLTLQFPFSAFAGLDPASLFSIEAALEPQIAGDMKLSLVQTFGTPLNETICNDGIDNNNNGLTDCQDPDCVRFPACGLTVPALSPSAIAVTLAMLSAIGLLAIWRSRRLP